MELEEIAWDELTGEQIYGTFNAEKNEYKDGELVEKYRNMAKKCGEDEKERWLFIKGQVHAMRIENLNAVLDDNKKLVLANGEILKLH